jgi:biotin carboxylase
MRTILFIGAGQAQSKGISTAKRLGYRVLAIDGNPSAPGLELADIAKVIDVTDIEEAIKMAKRFKVDGVLSIASDICLPAVAAVNEALGLKGLSKNQVNLTTNKALMRKRFRENRIPGPNFSVFCDEDKIVDACTTVGFPSVMKPVDSAGSRGVFYVNSIDQVSKAFQVAKTYSHSGYVILEEFMPGKEVSVEAFVAQGKIKILTLSDKVRTPPPYLLDTALQFPSAYESFIQNKIKDTAYRAIKVLELDNCPVHMELIISDDKPKIVEVASRGPGFKVYTDIIPHVTGTDCIANQINLLFNKKVDLERKGPLKGACLLFLGSNQEGLVKTIKLAKNEKRHPVGLEVDIYVKPGDRVRKLTCGADRLGHILALADTRRQAVEIANEIYNHVDIQIE